LTVKKVNIKYKYKYKIKYNYNHIDINIDIKFNVGLIEEASTTTCKSVSA